MGNSHDSFQLATCGSSSYSWSDAFLGGLRRLPLSGNPRTAVQDTCRFTNTAAYLVAYVGSPGCQRTGTSGKDLGLACGLVV